MVGFICVIFHDAVMKRSNSSLTKDEISAFWSLFIVKQLVLATIITIKEGLGSIFLATINTIGGGIYLRFLSWCSDEEEPQFFDKG